MKIIIKTDFNEMIVYVKILTDSGISPLTAANLIVNNNSSISELIELGKHAKLHNNKYRF